jgi:mono/diheme cytochrome c family protein
MTKRPLRRVTALRGRVCKVAMLMLVTSSFVGAQVRERDRRWTAPPKEASRSNPLDGRPDAAAGGAKLFQQRCASCHGNSGRGTAKGPNLTAPEVQSQRDGALFWKISSGNAYEGMPTFSFLPVPQRWQLVLHLRALPGHIS